MAGVTVKKTVVDEAPVTSPEAEELVESGATPVAADLDAIIAQMQAAMAAQAAQIQQLLAERGLPSDPVASAVTNLLAHVRARSDQYPQHEFDELLQALNGLGDEVTVQDAELVKELVADVVDRGRHLELGYLPQLARDLHKETLKAGK